MKINFNIKNQFTYEKSALKHLIYSLMNKNYLDSLYALATLKQGVKKCLKNNVLTEDIILSKPNKKKPVPKNSILKQMGEKYFFEEPSEEFSIKQLIKKQRIYSQQLNNKDISIKISKLCNKILNIKQNRHLNNAIKYETQIKKVISKQNEKYKKEDIIDALNAPLTKNNPQRNIFIIAINILETLNDIKNKLTKN